MAINKDNERLEIVDEIKGIKTLQKFAPIVGIVIVIIFSIYSLFANVIPNNDNIMSIILKWGAVTLFLMFLVYLMMDMIKNAASKSGRTIIFDNFQRKIIDGETEYSYDDIKSIETVSYMKYKANKDEKAIDGTSTNNKLTTFVARVELESNKTIALKVGTVNGCKKIVKAINEHMSLEK